MCGERCVPGDTPTPPAGAIKGTSKLRVGQPLFSFQDKLEPFLCFPLPVHSQEGPPALPAWGEELRDVAKQAPGVPVPGPRQAGGAGALSGWSSSERALSLQHAGPRAEGLTRCGPMCAGRTVLPRCTEAPLTAPCPVSPAGSAPPAASWRCRGPCPPAGTGYSADLHRGEQGPRELHCPPGITGSDLPPTTLTWFLNLT